MLSYVWLYSINLFYLGGSKTRPYAPHVENVFLRSERLTDTVYYCLHSNGAIREYSHRMFNRAKLGAASQLHVKTLLHVKSLLQQMQ